jgi:hypothetical protein
VTVPAGGSATVDVPARTDVKPGEAAENCFLILRVSSGRRRWRVLARATVRLDARGIPWPRVEAVDVHPA